MDRCAPALSHPEGTQVFLCHNHKDKPAVRSMALRLRETGVTPWLDEESIASGRRFSPMLEFVIDQVPVAVVLLGPHGLGRWQELEYAALLQRFVEHEEGKGRKRLTLIPVLLAGCRGADEVPVFLRGFDQVDSRQEGGFDNARQMDRLVRAILGEGHAV